MPTTEERVPTGQDTPQKQELAMNPAGRNHFKRRNLTMHQRQKTPQFFNEPKNEFKPYQSNDNFDDLVLDSRDETPELSIHENLDLPHDTPKETNRLSHATHRTKSSQWLSEGQIFDKQFQDMFVNQQKRQDINPLNSDHLVEKHGLIFGIQPNQRLLGQMKYKTLISKPYITRSEKITKHKLENFLKSDKLTHQELYNCQELQRRRSNLEIDYDQYR